MCVVVFWGLFLFSSSYHLTRKLAENVSNKLYWVRSICLVVCVMMWLCFSCECGGFVCLFFKNKQTPFFLLIFLR